MPPTGIEAAMKLRTLIKSTPKLTARQIAKDLGVTEAWLSRRLNSVVEMKIDEYSQIGNAIEAAMSNK